MPTVSETDMLMLAELASRRPAVEVAVAAIGIRPLTDFERDELREALADVLVEQGLKEGDEPNQFGLQIERLIDLVGRF
jgi:DNA-binding GntR family transcriptional regulator